MVSLTLEEQIMVDDFLLNICERHKKTKTEDEVFEVIEAISEAMELTIMDWNIDRGE